MPFNACRRAGMGETREMEAQLQPDRSGGAIPRRPDLFKSRFLVALRRDRVRTEQPLASPAADPSPGPSGQRASEDLTTRIEKEQVVLRSVSCTGSFQTIMALSISPQHGAVTQVPREPAGAGGPSGGTLQACDPTPMPQEVWHGQYDGAVQLASSCHCSPEQSVPEDATKSLHAESPLTVVHPKAGSTRPSYLPAGPLPGILAVAPGILVVVARRRTQSALHCHVLGAGLPNFWLAKGGGEPSSAQAGLQEPPGQDQTSRQSSNGDLSEPLHRLTGGVRRTLHVNSTKLQEAVKFNLDCSSRQQEQAAPDAPPDLGLKLRTLNISELAAELSGFVPVGRGGSGMVFQAVWQGVAVAAKFMAGDSLASVNRGALEGMLAAAVHHPNIVQTYGFDVTCVLESSFEAPCDQVIPFGFSSATVARMRSLEAESARIQVLLELDMRPGMYMTHIVMELCDRGSLLTALQKGVFRVGGIMGDNELFHERVVLRAALRTARDVARGMQHLHAAGIIHGDLKPGNVLLKGSRNDRRGFVAKIADFGLSKVVTNDAPLEMQHWSTVAYMAPEVIKGIWCKQSDVYSFGVVLWQLMCGDPRVFKGLTVQEVLLGVLGQRLHLQWPRHCHSAVAQLGEACMAFNVQLRPTFQEIGDVLTRVEKNIRDEFMLTPPT